ncbi:MAG: phosphoenolpyruvate carboxykinase (ATP) [Gemmatimonadales bacterium]|nr:phosphoenolpyruvate carboxykinase (ATP) [Gemmatimonadales bacterium]
MATKTAEIGTIDRTFDLSAHGITVTRIKRNPPVGDIYADALSGREPGAVKAANGALVAFSGAKTGRSPNDKHVVSDPETERDVWWGPVNFPIERESFRRNRERARAFLNAQDLLYVIDGFAGWDPAYRLNVRIICNRPYHALFMHNMLIRPTPAELAEFGEPDFVVYNAGQEAADPSVEGVTSPTSVDLSFADNEACILGTEYAGEMKKGVFTIMNYLMPKRDVLSMHCSATTDPATGASSLLFGLSGTGKTTLSADPNRRLIGDDEHCWTDSGIFNIEGGCYAKTIDLSEEKEPDIYRALRYGAVLENVVLRDDGSVDWSDSSITQNTRGSYPIEFIDNAQVPCVAGHPTDVIFLTADAFGVLPPVSRLTPEQAMYHFISGYTAKVAGTEVGVTDPVATFSPCFGGPFLVWHPAKYARLLADRMDEHGVKVWLVNTGWSGGPFGIGARIDLPHTRRMVDAIHAGELGDAPTEPDPVFGVHVVTAVPGVPGGILRPRATWPDPAAYDEKAAHLARLFRENFREYEDDCPPEVCAAGPVI